MIKNKTISLILPCRNEQKALAALLKRVPLEVDEVIVVDNLSKDKTVEVAKESGARVFIESRVDGGIGYGFALATGIKNATGDIIVCMDGDGSYPVRLVPRLGKLLDEENLDFISCNRLPVKFPKKMSPIRMTGVWILNLVFRLLYNYPIQDSLTGMWVFKKKVINELTLFQGGWDFSLEIKINVVTNKNIAFRELHIPYQDRIFDQSKQNLFKTGFNHFIFLFKEKLKFIQSVPAFSLLEN